jgi:sugar phosphate isomerase/epimerase
VTAPLKLGLSSYGTGQWSFEELLRFLRRHDLHYLELWPYTDEWGDPSWGASTHLSERFLDTARVLLKQYEVHVASVNTSAQHRLNRTDDVPLAQKVINACIDLAAALDAPFVDMYVGYNPTRDPFTTVQLFPRLIGPCVEHGEKRGVTLLIENHFDMRAEDLAGKNIVRWPESLLALIEEVGSERLRINFDPCNFYIAGIEPYPYAYELLKSRIAYVHLKDAVRFTELLYGEPQSQALLTDSIHGNFTCVPVGSGGINFEGLFSAFKRDGYDGIVTFEPHTAQALFEDTLQKGIDYVRAKLGQP